MRLAGAAAAEDMRNRPCWRRRPAVKSRLRRRVSISAPRGVMLREGAVSGARLLIQTGSPATADGDAGASYDANGAAQHPRLPSQFPVAAGELRRPDHAILARRQAAARRALAIAQLNSLCRRSVATAAAMRANRPRGSVADMAASPRCRA